MTQKFRSFDGFTYYSAGYGPRYGDWTGQAVCLDARKVEDAIEKAAEFERKELPGYCEEQCGDCPFCCPDVITGMVFSYRAKELFSAKELMEHRRDLLKGEVVWLSR